MVNIIRLLSVTGIMVASFAGVAEAAPRIEGDQLVMTTPSNDPGERFIESIPERIEDVKRVVFRDADGALVKLQVDQVVKLMERRATAQGKQGEIEVRAASYMLVGKVPETVPPAEADFEISFVGSHLESSMVLVHVTDAYLEGEWVGRDVDAGHPGLERILGKDSYSARDVVRTR